MRKPIYIDNKQELNLITMKAMSFEQIKSSAESIAAISAADVFNKLSAGNNLMDHFYLTGYEGLCLGLDHKELTRAMISSAVPMCGEILVIGSQDEIDFWGNICSDLHIGVKALSANAALSVGSILKENPRISNILCSAELGSEAIASLCAEAHRRHVAVIVDNAETVMDMAAIESASIDFAISASEADTTVGVIIARRSRLVMTEGNARRGEHDIYAVWQDSLVGRNPTWVPMA